MRRFSSAFQILAALLLTTPFVDVDVVVFGFVDVFVDVVDGDFGFGGGSFLRP